MWKRCALFLSAVVVFAGIGVFAWAAPATDDASVMEAMILLLREKGILTPEEAAEMSSRLKRDKVQESDALEERLDRQLAESEEDTRSVAQTEAARAVESKVAKTLPEWIKKVKFSGDIRLRYQGDFFSDGNTENIPDPNSRGDILNTTNDRTRFRYRARLGLAYQLSDPVTVGFRLATGNDRDPVSTNDTLGDYFNKDGILLDQAYLKVRPLRDLVFWGGRIPNPFFSTDLVWDRDLNFEGVALNHTYQWLDNFGTFVNLGAFPLQEVEFSQKDKWLFGGQAGFQYEPVAGVSTKLGVAYYHFQNIKGEAYETGDVPGSKDWSAPLFMQKGNLIYAEDPAFSDEYFLAADYQELNITAMVDIGFWHPVHVVLIGDYVTNLGFDKKDIEDRFGVEIRKETDGYLVGVAVGYPKVRDLWQWQGSLFYKYLEADAVVDAFTDSDFHLGGTNCQGWILGAELGLHKNVWLSARWLSADEIEGPKLSVDTIQVNLNAAF
jgi:polyhydroxyalkanoate synthesis regulator phasin